MAGGFFLLLEADAAHDEHINGICMRTDTGHFVIAVAGPSGAGKSTLVKELVRELKDAVALSFDDYDPSIVSSTSYPKDLVQWLAEGANPDSWATPQMIADLQALLNGEIIISPDSKSMLKPATFVGLEEEKCPSVQYLTIAFATPSEEACN